MNQTGQETIVQDSQPRPRRLTLARETLRSLGDATLARAAGGTLFEEPMDFGGNTTWGRETSGSEI